MKKLVSMYVGKLTRVGIMKNINKLKSAYPEMQDEFYGLMIEILIDSNFSDKRFTDAVNHVINTHKENWVTIAHIVQYDKKVSPIAYHFIKEMNKTHNKN